jgi:hypothetical protein
MAIIMYTLMVVVYGAASHGNEGNGISLFYDDQHVAMPLNAMRAAVYSKLPLNTVWSSMNYHFNVESVSPLWTRV